MDEPPATFYIPFVTWTRIDVKPSVASCMLHKDVLSGGALFENVLLLWDVDRWIFHGCLKMSLV